MHSPIPKICAIETPGENLLSIGDYAFITAYATQINIPITVETIGNFAHGEDNASESLTFTLNNNLQQIGQGAFKVSTA